MPRPLDLLLSAGIRPSVDVEAVLTGCTRIAGVLVDRGMRRVGLLPAGPGVAVPAIALQLARGLIGITGRPCAVIDAGGTWPVVAPVTEGASFTVSWLLEDLALLALPGGVERRLEATLVEAAVAHGTLVVDLTGTDRSGEWAGAIDVLDGTVVVARAGVTTDDELLRWQREIPPKKQLGVLLAGAA